MKNRYKKSLLILLIITCLISCSCSTTTYDSSLNEENSIEVTDCVGNTVRVKKQIDNVACLFAITGHIVTLLGDGEKIVAVSRGLKRDKVLNIINPHIKDALMPKSSGAVNIEELAKADADVAFVDLELVVDKASEKRFKKINVPPLVVDFNSIEEQQYAVEMIAKVLGREKEAKEYIDYYNSCINKVRSVTEKIPEEEKVRVYHSVNEASRTDPKNSVAAEWTEIAGVLNVSVNEGLKLLDNKYFANMEQILLWNPDVIIVNEDGVDEYIMNNKKWQSLKAVKNNKVYLLPNGVSRWGHPNSMEIPLAIMWTAKKIYPDRFEDIDMKEEVKYFYKEFFDYELSDELIGEILEGKGMRLDKKEVE